MKNTQLEGAFLTVLRDIDEPFSCISAEPKAHEILLTGKQVLQYELVLGLLDLRQK
jgi:hypothetical protein